MAKKKKDNDFLKDLYEDMSLTELKDEVIKNLKLIKTNEASKKDYMDSFKETINDLKDRVEVLIYWIGVKETEKERAGLETAAEKALEGGE